MKRNPVAKLFACLFFMVLALLPVFVASPRAYACDLPDGSTNGVNVSNNTHICCPAGATDSTSCFYEKYINPLIALLSAAVGLVVVIAIIFGAIQYITAGGDPQRSAEGRKRIITALIGLAAYILLYGFLQFIVPGGLLNG